MKKLLIGFSVLICIISNFNSVSAQGMNSEIVSFKEINAEGYLIETIVETSQTAMRSTSIKGSKTINYKDTKGNILWSVKVNGTFTYNGKTAKCVSSTMSTKCTVRNWKLSNKKTSYYGAVAEASVTAKEHTFLGISVKTINQKVKLTCSANGKLT